VYLKRPPVIGNQSAEVVLTTATQQFDLFIVGHGATEVTRKKMPPGELQNTIPQVLENAEGINPQLPRGQCRQLNGFVDGAALVATYSSNCRSAHP